MGVTFRGKRSRLIVHIPKILQVLIDLLVSMLKLGRERCKYSTSIQNRKSYYRSHSTCFLEDQEKTRIKPQSQLFRRTFLYCSFE